MDRKPDIHDFHASHRFVRGRGQHPSARRRHPMNAMFHFAASAIAVAAGAAHVFIAGPKNARPDLTAVGIPKGPRVDARMPCSFGIAMSCFARASSRVTARSTSRTAVRRAQRWQGEFRGRLILELPALLGGERARPDAPTSQAAVALRLSRIVARPKVTHSLFQTKPMPNVVGRADCPRRKNFHCFGLQCVVGCARTKRQISLGAATSASCLGCLERGEAV
jgi:hypothetical protein